MSFLVLLGRIFFSLIFILSGIGHFDEAKIAYGASQGVFWPSLFVPLSGLIAILGGLSILLGFYARYGAVLIVIFLVPVTLVMHQFWGLGDPNLAAMQQINFMKNLSMLGGALMILYFGSGPLSIKN